MPTRYATISIFLLLLMMINTMAAQQAPGAEIVCLTVDDPNNYEAVTFLNRYATQELRPAGHSVTILEGNQPLPTDIPGLLKAVPRADLLIVFIRRATPPAEQLEAIKKHLNAGKPLLGIRTANHAFLPQGKDAKPPEGGAAWPEFTPAVLGGQNTGYETKGLPYRVTRHPDAPAKTPFLKGIDPSSIRGYQSLYLVLPLAEDATPLLLGKAETDTPAQPLAWYRTYGPKQAKVFYTSLGAPEDVKQPEVVRLYNNAITWLLAD